MTEKKPLTDHEVRLAAVLAMCELFRPQLSEEGVDLYARSLSDIPAAQVVAACARLAATAKFRPVPSEVRETCGAGLSQASDRAAFAFQALKDAIPRVGVYRSPDFDDHLINATVRNLGGWQRACDMPQSEFDVWYRKEFIQVYEMFCRVTPGEAQAAPLTGEHEDANRAAGITSIARTPVVTGLPWARRQATLPSSKPQQRLEAK